MKELIEDVVTEEVIDMPEEEPVLDPDEIITEDFGVICRQDGEVTAYGFWTGTRANVQRLEEWAEFGYEKTSDKYVQGYDGKWYVEGTEPAIPDSVKAEERIAELKQQLLDTDYVVIKIAEGSATAEEYADIIAARRRWRTEINTLESPAVEPAKDSSSEDVVELYSMEI